jgi:hypothetical protein
LISRKNIQREILWERKIQRHTETRD